MGKDNLSVKDRSIPGGGLKRKWAAKRMLQTDNQTASAEPQKVTVTEQ